VNVTNGVIPNMSPVTVTSSISFRATYSGDAQDVGPVTSACEPLTVNKINSNTTTAIHNASHSVVTSVALGTSVHDSATVTGAGPTPTGSLTFTFYTASSGCTGNSVGAGTVALNASGVADPSSTEGPLPAGSYSFQATYGGDSIYNGSTSSCEPLTVNKANSSTSPAIHNANHALITSAAVGLTVHDSATGAGLAAFMPTGNVTFTFYTAASDCTGASVGAGTVALDVTIVADPSDAEGPLAAGSYSFQASYGGDSNYNASTSSCEPLTINKADSS